MTAPSFLFRFHVNDSRFTVRLEKAAYMLMMVQQLSHPAAKKVLLSLPKGQGWHLTTCSIFPL